MKTREEYIALITSHAEELQNTFGITSLRLFGSVARNQHLNPFLLKEVEREGIEVIAER